MVDWAEVVTEEVRATDFLLLPIPEVGEEGLTHPAGMMEVMAGLV
jgi:hypothetical protein